MCKMDLFISEAYMAVFILYKNNGSHSTESGGEAPWRTSWTFHNCNYDVLQAWMFVAEVLNLELPHLVNEIQTQTLWLKLHHFWAYSCQITWNIFNGCITRCLRILNNIIKAKGVCKMTFGNKIRKSWICKYIIRVLKAIIWL